MQNPDSNEQMYSVDIFPNYEKLQLANWQNATDILIATVKAQRQNFSWGEGLEIPLISA